MRLILPVLCLIASLFALSAFCLFPYVDSQIGPPVGTDDRAAGVAYYVVAPFFLIGLGLGLVSILLLLPGAIQDFRECRFWKHWKVCWIILIPVYMAIIYTVVEIIQW